MNAANGKIDEKINEEKNREDGAPPSPEMAKMLEALLALVAQVSPNVGKAIAADPILKEIGAYFFSGALAGAAMGLYFAATKREKKLAWIEHVIETYYDKTAAVAHGEHDNVSPENVEHAKVAHQVLDKLLDMIEGELPRSSKSAESSKETETNGASQTATPPSSPPS